MSFSSAIIFPFERCSKPVAVSAGGWETVTTAPAMWCGSVHRAIVVTVYRVAVIRVSNFLLVGCDNYKRTIPYRYEI